MLPLESACLDPVVTINSSEIGTPTSAAKIWHFSCFLVLMAAGVDSDVEFGHVIIQVGLADLGVRG
jgi:hypothetical protein